jgi:hypothetical protein
MGLWLQCGSLETQISPLRLAPVEMTFSKVFRSAQGIVFRVSRERLPKQACTVYIPSFVVHEAKSRK